MPRRLKPSIRFCTRCGQQAEYLDSKEQPWCERHSDRGQLIEYGMMLHWTALDCYPYAIAEGFYFWFIAAGVGSDDFVRVALATIEALYEEAV